MTGLDKILTCQLLQPGLWEELEQILQLQLAVWVSTLFKIRPITPIISRHHLKLKPPQPSPHFELHKKPKSVPTYLPTHFTWLAFNGWFGENSMTMLSRLERIDWNMSRFHQTAFHLAINADFFNQIFGFIHCLRFQDNFGRLRIFFRLGKFRLPFFSRRISSTYFFCFGTKLKKKRTKKTDIR